MVVHLGSTKLHSYLHNKYSVRKHTSRIVEVCYVSLRWTPEQILQHKYDGSNCKCRLSTSHAVLVVNGMASCSRSVCWYCELWFGSIYATMIFSRKRFYTWVIADQPACWLASSQSGTGLLFLLYVQICEIPSMTFWCCQYPYPCCAVHPCQPLEAWPHVAICGCSGPVTTSGTMSCNMPNHVYLEE